MIREQLAEFVSAALAAVGVEGTDSIHLEQPARRDHGDWSTNTALVRAKAAKRPPRDLAGAMVDWMNANLIDGVKSVEIAGPGFINFRLDNGWLTDVLRRVVAEGVDGYGRLDIGAGATVLVEFVSANPTGPLHAGHARNAFFGDAVRRVLARVGYAVSTECYLNDRGVQMKRYAESLAARAAGEDVGDEGYRGHYIGKWAAEMPAGSDPLAWGYERALQDQREVLASVGIEFDRWFSERSLVDSDAIEATLNDLRAAGALYEKDDATWLRATEAGDDKDRVVIKSDGQFTYFLPDIAYHRDKFERGYERLIDVWGADHHGYVVRLRAALLALGHSAEQFDVKLTQMVRLMRNGAEVKLSKRSGELLEMREVIEEIGADAARITYLLQSVDTPQTIDLDVVTAQSMDNPVYYVQMAHTRVCAIERVAAERGVVRPALGDVDLSVLVHPREADALRALYDLPDTLALAARELEPHRVTAWLRTTAGAVHGWYHDCPVLAPGTPPAVRDARLWLAEAMRIGLRVGLDVLGVTAPEAM